MTDPAPLDVADRAITLSADTMGHDFLAALLAELRQMPDHWLRLNEERQQAIIERLKEKIRLGTEKAVGVFMQGEFPAVPAELEKIACGANLTATLSVRRDALCRHALIDAQGKQVLVIITDAERWTRRMDEIKARGDQMELWDASYNPAKDQPAYRRDQDRTAAGPTWADLKKSLGVQLPEDGKSDGVVEPPPPEGPPDAPEAIAPTDEHVAPETDESAEELPAESSDLTERQMWALPIYALREQLAQVGIAVSFGQLQGRSDDELHQAKTWAEAYAADADSCKIDKPQWLPPLDPGVPQ